MKKKVLSKILAVVSSLAIMITSSSINVFADNQEIHQNNSIVETSILDDIISVEEFQRLRQEELSKETADGTRAITVSSDYIYGYNWFTVYNQYNFTQTYSCGPTTAANILSYFKESRGVDLYSSSTITQSMFDTLANYVGYNPSSGTSMTGLSNGLQNYCSDVGKSCTINTYWFNLWSDVTRDIGYDMPILVNDLTDSHLMAIFGYDTLDGDNYLFVCTGVSGFGYLKWGLHNLRMRSISIS